MNCLKNNQKGFTLVEIMMVVIIMGILAVLGVPRYQKYLLESKLSEAAINYGEIKQGESKFYNSEHAYYKGFHDGNDTLLEVGLRIELGEKENFDYYVTPFTDGSAKTNSSGFVVQAALTTTGADNFGSSTSQGMSLFFVYPKEYTPTSEAWAKGWNDEEFFGGTEITIGSGDSAWGSGSIVPATISHETGT